MPDLAINANKDATLSVANTVALMDEDARAPFDALDKRTYALEPLRWITHKTIPAREDARELLPSQRRFEGVAELSAIDV